MYTFLRNNIKIFAIIFIIFFATQSQAAVYDFEQTSWLTVPSLTDKANHTENRTSWNSFYSKSDFLDTSLSGEVSLLSGTSTMATGTLADDEEADFSGGSLSKTKVVDEGALGHLELGGRKTLKIVAGYNATCAIYEGGIMKCWGADVTMALSGTSQSHYNRPSEKSAISNIVDIDLDGTQRANHVCAVLSDGTVKCYGYGLFGNNDGYLSFGELRSSRYGAAGDDYHAYIDTVSVTPLVMTGISSAIQVASSYSHSCAVISEGLVYCWGKNPYGEFGTGETSSAVAISPQLANIANVEKVGVGYDFTCALVSTGEVKCWGLNSWGQLGDGTTEQKVLPVSVLNIENAIDISVGAVHTCALISNGTIKCWGTNTSGCLGDGTSAIRATPVEVVGISNAVSISAGNFHTCAALSDGTIKCWGSGTKGELGNNSRSSSLVPVFVSNITTAISVSAGYTHSCALLNDGSTKCWGENFYGELGNGEYFMEFAPTQVGGLSNVTKLINRDRLGMFCALISGGAVKCWGDNYENIFVGGVEDAFYSTPFTTSLTDVIDMDIGYGHACAHFVGGQVKCWGQNNSGQAGVGNNVQVTAPTVVAGIDSPKKIVTGDFHSCAILSDDTVKCWGENWGGILGTGGSNLINTPREVPGIANVVDISAGKSFTCVVLSDTTVKCWGRNSYGQLGDGTFEERYSPTTVVGLSGVTKIEASSATVCAQKNNGTAVCWGDGYFGQRGDGFSRASWESSLSVPASVAGLSNASSTTVGFYTACSVLTSGQLFCWGSNKYANLGVGHSTGCFSGALVPDFFDFKQVLPGDYTSCGVTNSGIVRCWGHKAYMGNGDENDISFYSSTVPENVYNDEYTNETGTFESRIFDTGYNLSFGTFDYTYESSMFATISMKIRTGTSSDMIGASPWTTCNTIASGQSALNSTCVNAGDRYVQYQATLNSSLYYATPKLSEATIHYYQTAFYDLVFSPYDSTNVLNSIVDISWLGSGDNIDFQIRTAEDSGGSPGTWSSWIGTSGANGYYTSSSTNQIYSSQKDLNQDQWFQLKAIFEPSLYDNVVLNFVSVSYGWCDAVSGATAYNAFPTCGASACSSGYSLSGEGSSATCVCSVIDGATAYNAFPTCGASACSAGYSLSGEGSNATCACSAISGATAYNAFPTCGASACSSGYSLSGEGSGATCACSAISGATAYNAFPTCGASACSSGYSLSGEGSGATCACSAISGATAYNAFPTCGASACSSGYSLSGEGSSATCVVVPSSSGGSSGGGGGGGGGAGSSDTIPPNKPTDFKVVYDGVGNLLSWKNPSAYDLFKVILGKNNSAFSDSLTGADLLQEKYSLYNGLGESFLDKNVKSDGIYYYALSAYDGTGNYSKPLFLKIGTTTQEEKKPTNDFTGNGQEVEEDIITEEEEIFEYDYTSLYGLSAYLADKISRIEAEKVCGCSMFIDLSTEEKRIYDSLLKDKLKDLSDNEKIRIAYFIHFGTKTTLKLGGGERAGIINSFISTYGRIPANWEDWSDIIKIGNGRWPKQEALEMVALAKEKFEKVYLRSPDMNQANDNAAVTIMTYGLRPVNRNLNSEKTAILSFKHIFKYHPVSAFDWDIVRAIAYSGAKR